MTTAFRNSRYFSGQGVLLLADRDVNGAALGFEAVGNVSDLTLAIETEEFEHKESQTGARAVDLTIVQEINATISMTLESLDRDNLALALFGSNTGDITAGSVIDEALTAKLEKWIPLANVGVSMIVLTDMAGTTTFLEGAGENYVEDLDAGAIFLFNAADQATATNAIAEDDPLLVDYDFVVQEQVDAVLNSAGATKWARFHGLNTVDNPATPVVIDIFKAQIQPLSELALINDEIAQMEVELKILQDPLQVSETSKFFKLRQGTFNLGLPSA